MVKGFGQGSKRTHELWGKYLDRGVRGHMNCGEKIWTGESEDTRIVVKGFGQGSKRTVIVSKSCFQDLTCLNLLTRIW